MNNAKVWLIRIIRILLLIAAVIFSLILPRLWQGSYDARIENKLKKFSASVTTYQMQYKSFAQKMEMLSACESYGVKLETLAVEDYAEVMSEEQLAKIVREQLQELEECVEFYDFPVGQITAETMKSQVKYVMYTLTDKINISGIDYWEVTYQTEDFEISLKLDSEFYKIYGLRVNYGSIYDEEWKMWDYLSLGNNYTDTPDKSPLSPWAYSSELYDIMLSGLVSYWELADVSYYWVDITEDSYDADSMDDRFIGVVEFYDSVDWEMLTGQTDEEEEDAGTEKSADINEAYAGADGNGAAGNGGAYVDDGDFVSCLMHVKMNIYEDQGFGLQIQN